MALPEHFFQPAPSPLAAPWPLVMGILNVTPDSFSDGGKLAGPESPQGDPGRAGGASVRHRRDGDATFPDAAVARAEAMVGDGVDILDIGGESTRPGAAPVSAAEEIARTVPVIRMLRERGVTTPVSIDTMKAEVAAAALDAGADIVNDVTAGTHDPAMLPLCATRNCIVILMHMRGEPRDMQTKTDYGDVVTEVRDYLAARIKAAEAAGVSRECVWIDPGFGFAKLPAHNCELVRRLDVLVSLGRPVLLGASRKSTLGGLTGRPVEDRGPETLAAHLVGALKGASIVRVHEPGPMRRAITVARAMA